MERERRESSEEVYEDLKRWRLNPGILFSLMILGIFSAEVVVMIVLGFIPNISRYTLLLLDAVLLSALVFPLLYLLFFRPMSIYIKHCRRYVATQNKTEKA